MSCQWDFVFLLYLTCFIDWSYQEMPKVFCISTGWLLEMLTTECCHFTLFENSCESWKEILEEETGVAWDVYWLVSMMVFYLVCFSYEFG